MDPDPGGPKTYGSGSGAAILVDTNMPFSIFAGKKLEIS
jgi:hypothetical protein